MTRERTDKSYESLEEILSALESGKYPECCWIGKNYTKQSLIEDLSRIWMDQTNTRRE